MFASSIGGGAIEVKMQAWWKVMAAYRRGMT